MWKNYLLCASYEIAIIYVHKTIKYIITQVLVTSGKYRKVPSECPHPPFI